MTPDEIRAAADDAGPLMPRPNRLTSAERHRVMHDAIAHKTELGDRSLVWALRSHLDVDHGVMLSEVVHRDVDGLVRRHDALHAEGATSG